MKRIFGRNLILLAILLLLALAGTTEVTSAQSALTNASFDTPYNNGVANGWAPWHEERNIDVDCNTDSMYRRPSWTPEEVGGNNGQLWFDGNRSQHIGNSFATWNAGVFQTVSVTPGSYSFSTYAWGRASQDQYPAASDTSVNFKVRVGIDPNGAGLWTSSDIIWSAPITPHDNWQQAAIEVATSGDKITVFIAADFAGPGQCRKHLDIWFDAANLQATSNVVATATPNQVATATPNWNATLTKNAELAEPTATITPLPTEEIPPTAIPTLTPFPTPFPSATPNWNATATVRAAQTEQAQPTATLLPPVIVQPTAVPEQPTEEPSIEATAVEPDNPPTAEPNTATPLPTATPAPQGGTICVNTFADANANGVRDDGEGYMANVPLFIGKNGSVLYQGTSTGTEIALCYDDLAPGDYEVAQRLPSSLEMTTAGNLTITLSQGQEIRLEFGSRIRDDFATGDGNGDLEEVADEGNSAEISVTVTPIPEQAVVSADNAGLSGLTIAGIALSGFAVIMLGGVLIALLRR